MFIFRGHGLRTFLGVLEALVVLTTSLQNSLRLLTNNYGIRRLEAHLQERADADAVDRRAADAIDRRAQS